jgi:predicted ArsR family transcriptional regulator
MQMAKPPPMARLLGKTRSRILSLIRRGINTVNGLAGKLGVTHNAVRAHLATLQRDHLVHAAGETPGVRRPHTAYDLTPEAEHLFPKAYDAILSETLRTLTERSSPAQVREVMGEVGRRLGQKMVPGDASGQDVHARAQMAVHVIEHLGGLAELETTDDKLTICGRSCPLADLIPEHPDACGVAEAMLSEIVGTKVTERCSKVGRPRCRFEIAVA